LRASTGKTHGMTLRMSPPAKATARIASIVTIPR
jgi:hypothetical protein